MPLTVGELPVEDTWKDIVRIHEPERVDEKGIIIPRGTICCLTIGGKSKWVVARGLGKKKGLILMDRNVRHDLEVDVGQACDFTLRRVGWLKALWFPWKASDPLYRVPAQLGLIALFLGVVGVILGAMPLYEEKYGPIFKHQSIESSATPAPGSPNPAADK
ncbi:MAG: hypothetical protein ABSB35_35290 [Bryobacteraceae bacterium]